MRSAAASATSVLAAVALAGCGGGSAKAPPDDAATLVPAGALVYLHVSTDRDRDATKAAAKLAARFPGFASASASLVKRLAAPGCGVKLGRGDEAALALLDTGGASAGSLVLVDTGDDSSMRTRTCGSVQVRKIGSFVAVGQPGTLRDAAQLHAGRGTSLAKSKLYARETAALPKDRVANAWVTSTGVARLLLPQGGLLGIAGTLLDGPTLRAAAASIGAEGDTRAKVVVRSVLSKPVAGRGFAPTLPGHVPEGATAYVGAQGFSGAVAKLLPLVTGGGTGLAPLLSRAGAGLAPLAAIFSGEIGVTITNARPAPILTLTAPVGDAKGASRALANARPAVAKLLTPAGGTAPKWTHLGSAWQLRPARGVEVDYAVLGGRVVVATKLAGIRAPERGGKTLEDSGVFGEVEPGNPDRVSSVVFLDLNKLLSLGMQTGLDDSAGFRQVEADLRKIRAVGARTTGTGRETTAEIHFSIP